MWNNYHIKNSHTITITRLLIVADSRLGSNFVNSIIVTQNVRNNCRVRSDTNGYGWYIAWEVIKRRVHESIHTFCPSWDILANGGGPSHAPLSIIDDKLWGILGRGGREQSMEPFHPSWFHIYVTHIYVVSLWPIFFINSRTLNDLTDGSIKR